MTWNAKALVGLLATLGLMAPATAFAQTGPTELEPGVEDTEDAVDDEPDDEDDRPWSVGGALRMMVGQGTFVSPANDTEYAGEIHDGSGAFNRVSMLIGLSSSYQWNDWEFDGSWGFSQGLAAASGNVRPYEGRFQDIEFGASYKGWELGDTDVQVSPSFGANLPVSTASRTRTMLTTLSGGIGISRSFFDSLQLSYSIGGSRGFHRYTSPVLVEDDIQDEDMTSRLYRPDGTEAIGSGQFAVGRINPEWSLNHSLSAAIMFSPEVQVMASYSISNMWSYSVSEDDEFAADLQCIGRCSTQMASGMLMVNYNVNENMGVNLGLNTTQAPKTADQKSFNFPFWNFDGAAANRSMINIGLMGRY